VKRFLCLMTALMVVSLASSRALARDAFNGNWKVTVSPADDDAAKNGAKEFKDVLTFKGSQLTSAELKKKGFDSTPYDEDTRGGVAATFKCEMKSEKAGKAVWTGTSTGSDMSGELTLTSADGNERKYVWKGEKGN
jgi:hypothetical protein